MTNGPGEVGRSAAGHQATCIYEKVLLGVFV